MVVFNNFIITPGTQKTSVVGQITQCKSSVNVPFTCTGKSHKQYFGAFGEINTNQSKISYSIQFVQQLDGPQEQNLCQNLTFLSGRCPLEPKCNKDLISLDGFK